MGAIRTWFIAVAVLATGLAGTGADATASPGQFAMFQEQNGVFGAPATTLQTLRSLGATAVRVTFSWSSIAPNPRSKTPPGGFSATDPSSYPAANWAPYDELVRDAQRDGMEVDLVLTTPAPRWATARGEPRGGPPGVWYPSATGYGQFVYAVASRYSGNYTPSGASAPLPRISFWEIANEPNVGADLAPQANDNSTLAIAPRVYRAMLAAGWSGLRSAGHQGDTIVIGNLAPRGESGPPAPYAPQGYPGRFATTKPVTFTRLLYCVNPSYQPLTGTIAADLGCPTTASASRKFQKHNPALFGATGFGIHPYPFRNDPPTVAGGRDPNNVDVGNIQVLPSALDRLQRVYHSFRHLPIYNTEFGYLTSPPDHRGFYASPAKAAVYLNWAEYLSYRNPRIANTMQYLLYDPDPAESAFSSGLIFHNGTIKPAYYAYRMPIWVPVTQTRAGRPLFVWGCARPAPYAASDTGQQQSVQIQFQAGTQGSFQTLATVPILGPNCYVKTHVAFPASGMVRFAWTFPDVDPLFPASVLGTTIYSRAVQITVR